MSLSEPNLLSKARASYENIVSTLGSTMVLVVLRSVVNRAIFALVPAPALSEIVDAGISLLLATMRTDYHG